MQNVENRAARFSSDCIFVFDEAQQRSYEFCSNRNLIVRLDSLLLSLFHLFFTGK